MKEYYIIRFRGHFCRGFHYGTRDELAEALSRVGAKMTDEEPTSFERVGLLFSRRIHTRIKVYGRDNAFYDRFYNDIRNVFDKYGVTMQKELERWLNRAADRYCNMVADDLFEILASDGTECLEPNCVYIGRRSGYVPFSEFDERLFWDNMEYYCRVARPQDK